jgi:membrane protease YdiL (CAAX protease family)
MTTALGPAVPHHRVYVETFAIWVAGYLLLMVVARVPPISVYVPELIAQCGAMLLSLTSLAWPVLRGIGWKQIRRDIGWTVGPLPFLEPTIGVLTYCMAIPMACIGFACTFGLLFLQATGRLNFGGAPGPVLPGLGAEPADPFASDPSITHPIIELLSSGSMFELGAILVLAGVVAPIVEETMFRGVLYRHVRDGTRVLGVVSVIVSALVVNVIFGLVHPQGLFVVPALAALACGFVVAREWRGTLIPSIIAHGINNSLLLVAVMQMTH